ncbi:MAG: DUF551 domain-containing protein [Lachnoclostridium sp.]|nr:DUF551 domain-containing protein [Lachnoclostridium sp.]
MGRLIDADLLIERIRKNDVLPWDLDKPSQIAFEYCITAQPTVEVPFAYVANKWIPCSERMPEMHKKYLGDSEEYYMISDEVIATDGNNVGIYQYEIDDKCFRGWTDDGIKCENEITHWMPLPKPYGET